MFAPHDKEIFDEVNKVTAEDIKGLCTTVDASNPLIQIIGKDVDDVYLEKIKGI